jgi:hypothetical protein
MLAIWFLLLTTTPASGCPERSFSPVGAIMSIAPAGFTPAAELTAANDQEQETERGPLLCEDSRDPRCAVAPVQGPVPSGLRVKKSIHGMLHTLRLPVVLLTRTASIAGEGQALPGHTRRLLRPPRL